MKLPKEKKKIWTSNKGKRLEKRFGPSVTQLAFLLTYITAAFSYFFFFIKLVENTLLFTQWRRSWRSLPPSALFYLQVM